VLKARGSPSRRQVHGRVSALNQYGADINKVGVAQRQLLARCVLKVNFDTVTMAPSGT